MITIRWCGGLRATVRYRTSSFCANSSCVQVASLPDGTIAVWDSKEEAGQERMPLIFTTAEWDAFVAGVKAGEFDSERLRQDMLAGLSAAAD
jgi:Domain of unknown function (DUF397)